MKQFASTNADRLSRRDFLKVAGGLGMTAAGMTLLNACGANPDAQTAGSDTLETTTIRLPRSSLICIAPLYLAEDFLRREGFTDLQYVDVPTAITTVEALSAGQIDMGMQFAGLIINYVDAGKAIIALAGVQVGCFELFGHEQVKTIEDIKGKTVSVTALGGPDHIFLSSLLAYVGLDPNKDIAWVPTSPTKAQQQFTDGKLDAFLAQPPVVQELKAKKIGHVVLNSMMDKPWSQYYCCMAVANLDFVQKNPVATKRALRALLKATDICALQPDRAAKFMVDQGYTKNYDHALQAMKDIPYNVWREYDPEDTFRFYALQLHDVGMIKNSPDEIIKRGTDWTFLNELKAELKA
jgi:NitT/TauT family transport system substrate-binding protein